VPRDPRTNPQRGDRLYIHAGNAVRYVVANDGVTVRYTVGVHAYEMTLPDWRVRMVGAVVVPPARIEMPAGVTS